MTQYQRERGVEQVKRPTKKPRRSKSKSKPKSKSKTKVSSTKSTSVSKGDVEIQLEEDVDIYVPDPMEEEEEETDSRHVVPRGSLQDPIQVDITTEEEASHSTQAQPFQQHPRTAPEAQQAIFVPPQI